MMAALLPLAGTACLQKLESGAADNAQPRLDAAPPLTTATETPPIDLDTEGKETTNDPCVLTTQQAKEILTKNCAGCHGGGASAQEGKFDCVLDFKKLIMMTSNTVKDPKDPSRFMHFVVPGDPDDSRLYVRVALGEMPPPVRFPLPEIPRPTISDVSVLREWISSCMGGGASSPGPAPAPGPGPAPEGGAGGGAGGMGGGRADAGAAGGSGGASMPPPAPPRMDAGAAPPPPAPDAGVIAVVCGGAGQACCGGNVCNGGGCCVNNTCRASGQACGNVAGTCMNGSCLAAGAMACGGATQECCGNFNPVCTASRLRCVQQTCQACGGMGERCCAGSDANACVAGLECQPNTTNNSGTCQPCGGAGQFCCGRGAIAQQTCNGGLTCRAGVQGAPARCAM
jgi:hypothetical protein